MLAAAWDQNAGLELDSPVGAHLERVVPRLAGRAARPAAQTEVGFVTGATMANFTGLAAARHAVLRANGWDVEAQGLFGAPPITVIVGEEVHVSVLKALEPARPRTRARRARAGRRPGPHARRRAAADRRSDDRVRAGRQREHRRVRSAQRDRSASRGSGAWVHVDGAFGLWAAAAPAQRAADGRDRPRGLDARPTRTSGSTCRTTAASCSCATPRALNAAMAASAAYLIAGETRDPAHVRARLSRRARGVEVWAALRSLGRAGWRELIERNCATRGASRTSCARPAIEILNDVVLNQVLVSFGDAGAHATRDRGDSGGRHVLVRRHRRGRATLRCASAFRRGRRLTRTSRRASKPSCGVHNDRRDLQY